MQGSEGGAMTRLSKLKTYWPFNHDGETKAQSRPVTAVVFGSGGARGWAHIGVLKAFREIGFKPDIVAGTSIGSIAAAVYAADALDRFLAFSENMDWFKATQLFVEFGVHRGGLIEGRKVSDFIDEMIQVENIEDLPIPYAAVATNLETSAEVVFTKGSLIQAIRSSISIPGVFTPVHLGGKYLVDGGLVNPLPINVVREMGATHIVAININNNLKCPSGPSASLVRPGNLSESFREHFIRFHWGDEQAAKVAKSSSTINPAALVGGVTELVKKLPVKRRPVKEANVRNLNLFDVFTRSLRIAEDVITKECIRLNPPAVLIEPAVGDIATMDFSRATDAIEAGYQATLAILGPGAGR